MGIIRDVGTQITDEDIIQHGRGLYPDSSVERVLRFNRKDAGGVIYSSSCPMQKMLEIWTHTKYCRSQYRCHKCGESHEDQPPCDKILCVSSAIILTLQQQAKIREAMVLYKMSSFEANQAYLKPIGPSPLELSSANESPPLVSPQNSKTRMPYAGALKTPEENKRPPPVSPGYDHDAHEDCLVKFAPTFPKKLLVSKSGDELNEQTQLSLQKRPVYAVNKQLDQDNIIHSSKSREEEITSRKKNVYVYESFLNEMWSMEEDSSPAQDSIERIYRFEILIRDHRPDVIALNETFLKPEHRLTITNYTLLRSDRQDGYGGIAFAIKNGIPFSSINLLNLAMPDHLQVAGLQIGVLPIINIAPDITICTSARKSSWRVLGDPGSSDHFPIIIDYNGKSSHLTHGKYFSSRKYNHKKADWNHFKTIISQNIGAKDMQNLADLQNLIIDASDQAVPKYKVNNEEEERKHLKASTSNSIRSWEGGWKAIKKFSGQQMNNTNQIPSEECLNEIVDALTHTPPRPEEFSSNGCSADPFSLNELEEALSVCKDSAPGLVSIGYIIMKEIPFSAKSRMVDLINHHMINSSFPVALKKILVIPIRKKDVSKSYDPKATGYGVWAPKLNLKFSGKLPNHWSICSAEMGGIERAVTEITQMDIIRSIIISDSLSAIQKLKNTKWTADIDIRTVVTKTKLYEAKELGLNIVII
ncbi:hypothetical protein HHI36_008139 [Cryptolaemus montrouzieri]|uniref:Uncharacterized protein n=1 Tax=Cryptolaemus montrouzieri TaxID=559131 RepID=A0ABD2MRG4_9CUCU